MEGEHVDDIVLIVIHRVQGVVVRSTGGLQSLWHVSVGRMQMNIDRVEH